jgi:hypothetical protein
MTNQLLCEIIDKVIFIMNQNNCRTYDSDILQALSKTTYDIVKGEITNIRVDLSSNYKHN